MRTPQFVDKIFEHVAARYPSDTEFKCLFFGYSAYKDRVDVNRSQAKWQVAVIRASGSVAAGSSTVVQLYESTTDSQSQLFTTALYTENSAGIRQIEGIRPDHIAKIYPSGKVEMSIQNQVLMAQPPEL